MNKSLIASLVAAGLAREFFDHQTLGRFDVSTARQLVASLWRNNIKFCRFDAMRMADDNKNIDALQYLFASREIDEDRCRELTTIQLNDPAINVVCPPGTNGEELSHLLIDGIHRIKARFDRDYDGFYFYEIPLELAPRMIHDATVIEIPWGEMELVPGVGLVKRKKQ